MFDIWHIQDEYIYMKNIGKPAQAGYGGTNNRNESSNSGVSKFDRYKHQDENDDDMDEGNSTKVTFETAHKLYQQFLLHRRCRISQRNAKTGAICAKNIAAKKCKADS